MGRAPAWKLLQGSFIEQLDALQALDQLAPLTAAKEHLPGDIINILAHLSQYSKEKGQNGKNIYCCYRNRERLKCNGILYYKLSLKYYKSSPLLAPQLQHVGKHAPLSLLTPDLSLLSCTSPLILMWDVHWLIYPL